MKKFQRFSLCALFALCSLCASAYDFSAENEDGVTIYYNVVSSTDLTCEVTYFDKGVSNRGAYSGSVVVSKAVKYLEKTYTIMAIGEYALYDCQELTSVSLPNSVTEIGTYAFGHCYGLTEITIPEGMTTISDYAFYYCKGLTEITIPEGVTTIGSQAFALCEGLTGTLTIPNSVTSIGSYAFSCCVELTEITIGEGITFIGGNAFSACSGLIQLNFNAIACTSVGNSNSYAFNNCKNLSKANIGDKVTTIPAYLFYKCSNLKDINIPQNVISIGSYVFADCTSLTSITIPNSITTIESHVFHGCYALTEITIPESVTTIGSYAFYDCNRLTELIIPESVNTIEDDAFTYCSGFCSISNTKKTQLTCEMKITSNISGAESGIAYNDKFYYVDDDGYYSFTNLIPGNSYNYYFCIKLYNGSCSYHSGINITTIGMNPTITQISLTPETFIATGSYTEGDAVVTEVGFTNYETDGMHLSLLNLEPKTQYTVEYYVRASGNKFTTSTTFTTPAVEFTTLPAKATSNTVARIGATTNLSDDAMGAGFEWRRNDAPSTMPSSQAECPVIDGELSGTLNGLNPDTYYDFRPYYTSECGVSYYGDWVTLLTADAYVYFEPTVRTYEPTSVSSESATVKAYVVAGSDDITSQGFEYWQGDSSSAMQVKRASTTDENGVTRVEVSGQWMTATFEDLKPNTTYSYHAYATTAVDTTYGETISFTTDVPTGIETMTAGETEVYEVARYTMDGTKILHPVRGINILRYSDGTTKKVLVK